MKDKLLHFVWVVYIFGRGKHVLDKDSFLPAIPRLELYLKVQERWVLIIILG